MFNSRDEKIDFSDFYSPFIVGGNVENRISGEVRC